MNETFLSAVLGVFVGLTAFMLAAWGIVTLYLRIIKPRMNHNPQKDRRRPQGATGFVQYPKPPMPPRREPPQQPNRQTQQSSPGYAGDDSTTGLLPTPNQSDFYGAQETGRFKTPGSKNRVPDTAKTDEMRRAKGTSLGEDD